MTSVDSIFAKRARPLATRVGLNPANYDHTTNGLAELLRDVAVRIDAGSAAEELLWAAIRDLNSPQADNHLPQIDATLARANNAPTRY